MTHNVPGHRVCLVENEAMIAMQVEDMLDDLGHELVTVATRLEEALAAARNETVDLAILDLNLGGVLTYPAADVLAGRGSRSSSQRATGPDFLQNAGRGHLSRRISIREHATPT